jgi:predicted ATPase
MGEGVMNILGLIVHLAIAENRLFLVEEPENDVHPATPERSKA